MLNTLLITELELHTHIGVHAWEKQVPQKLLLDLALGIDTARAIASDDIDNTLDYSALATLLTEYAQEARHALIETLAHELMQLIIARFPMVQALELTLYKRGALAQAKSVAIRVSWNKSID